MNNPDTHAQEHQESNEVVVEVTGCPKEDARTVFDALCRSFASDRPADDVPEDASTTRPTVWTVTVDVSRTGPGGEPGRLSGPVTAEVQGGYRAVDRLRLGLAESFAVKVVGTASGDQEQEVRLRLENLGD
ncbi:hypothetical protein CP967_32525 [Streptomyces nitrosporeus]|uniref:Uncharacterized protein n=1 Tax=Streptomyces nitrosporeus TaxID=28894 RepID=A0A5J6FMI0_9ACTN|nr:hypothetical protein [Streptomyces nitrosporeus]QEU76070.1 hypothetical protein CP967_32525 [Streptomyces nitrosporeus]GGZ07623.1 hypothetical protein GCM10010327_42570 [Streptomyces nitrosporeus]